MNIFAASKHQKLKWIEEGEYVDLLIKDKSKWIEIAARKRRVELRKETDLAERENLKESMDADLFDVIVLSAKTDTEVYELIAKNKFLTYFAKHENIGFRVRAKKQMKDYLNFQHLNLV